jgi:hypothetical protein
MIVMDGIGTIVETGEVIAPQLQVKYLFIAI